VISMTTYYQTKEGVHVLEFPELETIDLNDPDIQKAAITWNLAHETLDGGLVFTKNSRIVATGGDYYE
jgi:hypothetical protein